jgi:hypothetical protein
MGMEKIIWIAGMSRSGSMWVYNVIRDALAQSGYEVLPKHVPWKADEKDRIVLAEALPDQDPNRVFVLKTHHMLNPDIPRMHVFSTIRDIRDALISWMRFINADFDMALKAAEDMTMVCDHYLKFPQDKLTLIHYGDIINAPAATLRALCQGLGITLTDEESATILSKYTKTNVEKRIAAKIQGYKERLQEGAELDGVEEIRGLNDSIRVYDRGTGFQSGHVSDYRDGDWRTILTAEQIAQMHERLGSWLERNGYA